MPPCPALRNDSSQPFLGNCEMLIILRSGIKGLHVKTIGALVDGDERPWRRTIEQLPGVSAPEEELYPAHVASIT